MGSPEFALEAGNRAVQLDPLEPEALGEVDAAFDAFGHAGPMAWDETPYLRYHPTAPLGALREDPRYLKLLQELDVSWGN